MNHNWPVDFPVFPFGQGNIIPTTRGINPLPGRLGIQSRRLLKTLSRNAVDIRYSIIWYNSCSSSLLSQIIQLNSTRFPHSAPLAPPRTWNGSGDRCGWWCSYPWFWSFAGRPARFAGAIGHPSISMVMKCYQCIPGIPGIPVYQFYQLYIDEY